MLDAGAVILCRYDTQVKRSEQQKRWRELRIVEGPHFSPRHKHGAVIRAADLSDPTEPGKEKVFYLARLRKHRVILLEARQERGRYDRKQRSARRVRWEDEAEPQKRARK